MKISARVKTPTKPTVLEFPVEAADYFFRHRYTFTYAYENFGKGNRERTCVTRDLITAFGVVATTHSLNACVWRHHQDIPNAEVGRVEALRKVIANYSPDIQKAILAGYYKAAKEYFNPAQRANLSMGRGKSIGVTREICIPVSEYETLLEIARLVNEGHVSCESIREAVRVLSRMKS